AFSRFWQALTPERFAAFPSLPALLAYLKSCTAAVVIDSARADRMSESITKQEADLSYELPQLTPEQGILTDEQRSEVWQIINQVVISDAERIVIASTYFEDKSPREILRDHTELFASINEVYIVKRRILARLRRHPELRRLFSE